MGNGAWPLFLCPSAAAFGSRPRGAVGRRRGAATGQERPTVVLICWLKSEKKRHMGHPLYLSLSHPVLRDGVSGERWSCDQVVRVNDLGLVTWSGHHALADAACKVFQDARGQSDHS